MKTKNLLSIAITILTCISSAQAQNVNIPDGIFNSYLLNNTAINTNGDYEIQVSEASVFNGGIYLYAGPGSGFGLLDGITDLTGIEAFVSLTYLDCSWNQLSSLNLSASSILSLCFVVSTELFSKPFLEDLERLGNLLKFSINQTKYYLLLFKKNYICRSIFKKEWHEPTFTLNDFGGR